MRNRNRQPAEPPPNALEFVPGGEDYLMALQPDELPGITLTPAERTELEQQVREALTAADTNRDGFFSAAEIRAAGEVDDMFLESIKTVRGLLQDAQVSRAPWLAPDHVTVDNIPLFNRAIFINAIVEDPDYAGLTRRDLDRLLRETLPLGVSSITLADQCEAHPQALCMRLGRDRVMIMRDSGPTI